MNNIEKIAVILIRVQALILWIFAVMEWGIIAVGTLLSTSLQLIPKNSVAYEARLLQSGFYLLLGLILIARSRSLARFLVSGLLEGKDD